MELDFREGRIAAQARNMTIFDRGPKDPMSVTDHSLLEVLPINCWKTIVAVLVPVQDGILLVDLQGNYISYFSLFPTI
jgi:hypothetical protein